MPSTLDEYLGIPPGSADEYPGGPAGSADEYPGGPAISADSIRTCQCSMRAACQKRVHNAGSSHWSECKTMSNQTVSIQTTEPQWIFNLNKSKTLTTFRQCWLSTALAASVLITGRGANYSTLPKQART
eukprot:366537-Chlamydomonas_euryale.AAC.16